MIPTIPAAEEPRGMLTGAAPSLSEALLSAAELVAEPVSDSEESFDLVGEPSERKDISS